MEDCIAAISTASGTGGIAVIRISGEGAFELARGMFVPANPNAEFTPNRMYAGDVYGEGFVDYGFLVFFKAPRSFTGEDCVEFHCHGGVEIARGILKKALSLGARAAERGEFTKRAFINGKLTLSSAEGMIDMINAESLALVRAGGMLYREKLSGEIIDLQNALKDILAAIAAEIDYPEEDLDGLDFKKISSDLFALSAEVEGLLDSYAAGRKIKNGVTVAICGKPNAGKSSLLNALLGYDKAIVCEEEGTTRDAVEGELSIEGIKYNLIDTAGIRERAGAVESIGIERAKGIIRSADVILSVNGGDGEAEIPQDTGGEIIRVFNKCDLLSPEKCDIAVSAATGEGIGELKKLLAKKGGGELSCDKAYLIEERHFSALKRASAALKSAQEGIKINTLDLISIDLKDAWEALGEITGETASEEIVNTVFEKFCVGK